MTEKRLLKLSLPEKLESPAMDSVERKELDVMVDMLLDVVQCRRERFGVVVK